MSTQNESSYFRDRWFKLFLGFLPLLCLFGAVTAMIVDLKNPTLDRTESCYITHVGKLAPSLRDSEHTVLFDQGSEPIHDIRFVCPTWGKVMINDPDAFHHGLVKEGMVTEVHHVAYRWFPEKWRLQIDQKSGFSA